MILKVIIDEPFYHQDSFFIANAMPVDGGKEFVVKGNAEVLPTDQEIQVSGDWVNHPKYGKQFAISAFIFENDVEAMQTLLGAGMVGYIGPAMAKKIVGKLKERTFAVLDACAANDWEAIAELKAIKGVGPINIGTIIDDWKEQGEAMKSMLIGIKAGLTPKQVARARKEFEAGLEHVIIHEPYRLMLVHGIGWIKADEVAKREWEGKVAIEHDSPYRHAAAVRARLDEYAKNGHTMYPVSSVLPQAAVLANVREIYWDNFKDMGIIEIPGGDFLTTNHRWDKEKGIYEMINRRLTGKPVISDEELSRIQTLDEFSFHPLADRQRDAVMQALTQPVSIITGGPGTGKTTTLAVILNVLDWMFIDYTLCAPTGKAARRMQEATGKEASTLHSTLKIRDDQAHERFYSKFVIVDEASMVDVSLMSALLSALPQDCHLVLIGDKDQLPPVGPGEPFNDFMTSGIPTVILDVVHRQAAESGIVQFSHAIMRGDTTHIQKNFHDLNILVMPRNEDLLPSIHRYASGNVGDIQYLTPINGSEYGQIALNKDLRAIYNPGENPVSSIFFRPEDRVIHTVNNYDLNVMNGEVGTVYQVGENLAIDDESDSQVEEREPDDFLGLFIIKEEKKDEDPIKVIVQYDQRFVGYRQADLEQLQFAWAITIHKSQGSEYDQLVVVVPYVNEGFMLRQLLYTGITRAKKKCTIIAARGALEKHIRNETRVRRYTILKELWK